jgi:hypothetical protein
MALQPHRLEFKPHRFEFIFGIVLAMAVTILAMTTWAAPSNPDNDSAAPIPPRRNAKAPGFDRVHEIDRNWPARSP